MRGGGGEVKNYGRGGVHFIINWFKIIKPSVKRKLCLCF